MVSKVDLEPTRCPNCPSFSTPSPYPQIEGTFCCEYCGYVFKPIGQKRSFTVIAKGPPTSNIEAGVYYLQALSVAEALQWKGSSSLELKVLRVFEGSISEAHD